MKDLEIENKETNSLMEYNKDKFYIGQFKNINGQIKSEYLIADQSALYNLVSENSFICASVRLLVPPTTG